jgi:hypothetical protein
MITPTPRIFLILLITLGPLFGTIAIVRGQTPQPIIVQAATAAPVQAATPKNVSAESVNDVIKLLQALKAGNEETLKRQKTVLEQLDELEKTAQQIKIFASRG